METLRANEVFRNTSFSLIVVESVDYQHRKTNSDCQLYGNIKPIALIVYSQDKAYALDMESNPISLDRLREDIPELNAIIISFAVGLSP